MAHIFFERLENRRNTQSLLQGSYYRPPTDMVLLYGIPDPGPKPLYGVPYPDPYPKLPNFQPDIPIWESPIENPGTLVDDWQYPNSGEIGDWSYPNNPISKIELFPKVIIDRIIDWNPSPDPWEPIDWPPQWEPDPIITYPLYGISPIYPEPIWKPNPRPWIPKFWNPDPGRVVGMYGINPTNPSPWVPELPKNIQPWNIKNINPGVFAYYGISIP